MKELEHLYHGLKANFKVKNISILLVKDQPRITIIKIQIIIIIEL